jgi:hypothetical protein
MSSRQKRRTGQLRLQLVERRRPKAGVVRIDRAPRGKRPVVWPDLSEWTVRVTTGPGIVTVGQMLRDTAFAIQQDTKLTPEDQARALRAMNALMDQWSEEPLIERMPDPFPLPMYYSSPAIALWPEPPK